MFCVEDPDHFVFFDSEHGGRRDCRSRCKTNLLPCQTYFAEKVPRSKHGDNRFLSNQVDHRELYASVLDIHYMFRWIALREDGRFLLIFHNLSGYTR